MNSVDQFKSIDYNRFTSGSKLSCPWVTVLKPQARMLLNDALAEHGGSIWTVKQVTKQEVNIPLLYVIYKYVVVVY